MSKKQISFEVNVPVIFMREGEQFVAYTPVLDVATSADSFEGAKKRFNEAVEIFFEELIELDTLDEVLRDLGWRKIKKQWEPPVVIAHESESVKVPA